MGIFEHLKLLVTYASDSFCLISASTYRIVEQTMSTSSELITQ